MLWGIESERGAVACGVPQGSVLGPLFFLIYVNDMARAAGGLELVLFADDTNIFAKDKNPTDLFKKVNRGLEELSKWFRSNKLTLNLKKTEYVYFGGPGGRPMAIPQGGIKIGEEQIFYFLQRGISLEQGVELMISGFCQDVFTELPLEFAAEADRLLSLKLEGSVG